MCLLWSADACCASPRCCDLFIFFSSAALKPTLAGVSRETRAAPTCSSAFHWETFSTSEWNDAASDTAAVVVYELLGSLWVFVTTEPTQRYHLLLLNAPWLVITCSKPPRRIHRGTPDSRSICVNAGSPCCLNLALLRVTLELQIL